MAKQTKSTLSRKRMYITLLLFFMIPATAHLINIFLVQYDISLMFAFNVFAAVMIMYDWNLFAIHYNRMKEKFGSCLVFMLLAIAFLFLWTWVGLNALSCRIMIPSGHILRSFGYARIGMLIAYSFSEAAAISIAFKAGTDHFRIRNHELQIILISGLLFGIVLTIMFLPSTNFLTILTTLLYNVISMIFLSYLYNQTNTFFPGMLGFAFTNLIYMLFLIL